MLEATIRWRSELDVAALCNLFSLFDLEVAQELAEVRVEHALLTRLQIAVPISEVDPTVAHLDDESNSVFYQELLCELRAHVVTVVDVHAPAVLLQGLHILNLFGRSAD